MIVFSGVLGWLGRSPHHTFSWNVAVAAATAYGTLALALVTWRLVTSAQNDATVAKQDQEARIRPCVYPVSNRHLNNELQLVGGDLFALVLQNGGQGLALNVTGEIHSPAGDGTLASTTLYPADNVQLPIRGGVPVSGGDEIWGRLEYRDLRERAWETRFVIEVGSDLELKPVLRAYGRAEGLSKFPYPVGWELRKNGAPQLALDSSN